MAGIEIRLQQEAREAELLWQCSEFVIPGGY